MKSYKQFIKESKTDIDSICQDFDIENYTINTNGSIDVDDNVYLNNRNLSIIPLKFGKVSGYFSCYNNNLTSLEGCPEKVGGDFYCDSNDLISLKGCPKKVNDFDCKNNQLISLEGCPEMIGGDFYCQDNKIRDFKGISEFFEGDFFCYRNPIEEIWSLFEDVRCIRLINEFDVIVDGEKVILDRLEEVFHQLSMDILENIKFNYYEII
jgi:hypothetical protein